MKIKKSSEYLLIFMITYALIGCRENSVPKPRGYFRIDLPEKKYLSYENDCPFTFEYPEYSIISFDVGDTGERCWFNIEFPRFRAILHISYKSINNNLEAILKESNEFVYSHTIKADAITEQPWLNYERRVFGLLYDLKGNTASSVQFFVTDSIRHFLRGALYFNTQPREDSLLPVIQFFRGDIVHLMETFEWKN